MFKTFKTFGCTALGVALAACSAAQARSIDPQDAGPIAVVVNYADLDIGHNAGARILRSRIKLAATRACGGAPYLRLLDESARFRRCRKSAMAHALANIVPSTTFAQVSPAPANP